MVFDSFTALVGLLAIVYASFTKYIQLKLIDKTEMGNIQKESKKLSEDYEKAKKAGNKTKMDEILKEQMDFLPKMNKVMFAQFKPMIIILAIFFAFTWLVGQMDPHAKDDIMINMTDDGFGCDKTAGDGIFSACYQMNSSVNFGKWIATVKTWNGNSDSGQNSTYFFYARSGVDDKIERWDTAADAPKGEPITVATDSKEYTPLDTLKIYATPQKATEQVTATLNNGTAFSVDLPFEIPIINVKRIEQPYWWFIFISLIANLILSLVMGRLGIGKKNEKVTV